MFKPASKFNVVWAIISTMMAVAVAVGSTHIISHIPILYQAGMQTGLKITTCGFLLVAVLLLVPTPTNQLHTTVTSKITRTDWVVSGVLFLLALALRAPMMTQSFWWDELSTIVRIVHRNWATVLTFSANGNNHVLNSVLIKLSFSLFHEGEWQARLPAMLISSVTPAVLYLLLRSYFARIASTIGASIFVFQSALIGFGISARGYSGGVLCVILITFSAAAILMGSKSIRMYVFTGICAVAFLPFSILPIAGHGFVAAFLLARRPWRTWQKEPAYHLLLAVAWTTALTMLLLGPQLGQILYYDHHGAANDHVPTTLHSLIAIATFVTGSGTVLLLGALPILVFGVWWLYHEQTTLAFALVSSIAIAGLYLALPGTLASTRLFFFLLPTVPVACAVLVSYATEHRRSIVWIPASTLIVIIGITSFGTAKQIYTTGNADLKGLAQELKGSTVVLVGPQSDMNRYYFPNAIVSDSETELTANTVAVVATNRPDTAKKDNLRVLTSWQKDLPSYIILDRRGRMAVNHK